MGSSDHRADEESHLYDQAGFTRTLSEFTRHLVTPHDPEQALTRLTGNVTEVLRLAGSGISLGRGEDVIFATAVPDRVAPLEEIQEKHRSGPCLDAYREQRVVATDDLRGCVDRWPEYCAVAERIGVSSVAAIPMQLQGITVGSLNLYGDGRHAWSEDDLAVATVMADVASVYLISASVIHQQAELNAQLQKALESRIVIEQAKGILANTHRISVDTAFSRMRQYARAHNATLHKVAEEVVNRDLHL